MGILEQSWTQEASALGYSNEKEMLFDLYHTHCFSINQMSEVLGHSAFNVRKRLLMVVKLPLRRRGGPNNKGQRKLKDVTHEELYGSPREVANKYAVHLGTVFAEKRLRQKEAEKGGKS